MAQRETAIVNYGVNDAQKPTPEQIKQDLTYMLNAMMRRWLRTTIIGHTWPHSMDSVIARFEGRVPYRSRIKRHYGLTRKRMGIAQGHRHA